LLANATGTRFPRTRSAFFVREYTAGALPDYQAAALLMAIYLRGHERRRERPR
jgi:pyrimidine-nucleoside phosphorylase